MALNSGLIKRLCSAYGDNHKHTHRHITHKPIRTVFDEQMIKFAEKTIGEGKKPDVK